MYIVQDLRLCLFSFLSEVISTRLVSSIFSVHSSTNLFVNLFLHLQFLQSLKSQDLKHSHSQLLGVQTNPLSQTPLSINYLHSHLHLSSFQRCLLLQTLCSNLHLLLQVSCHSMHLFSLVPDTRLNRLKIFHNIRNTPFCGWIVDIVATTT